MKRQSNLNKNLGYELKVKPEVADSSADLSTAEQHNEKPMFNDRIMEEICSRNNLIIAYRKVCKNKGSAGIDNITVNELPEFLKLHWLTIKSSLLNGAYKPKGIKLIEIPKPNGKGVRKLSIPCTIDRLIQQAILQILQQKWDPLFSENSYGFRPGKSAHQAILKAKEYVRQGYSTVVDIDLEKFFDFINHDRLMSKLAKNIKDQRLLKLIRAYLKSGIMKNGVEQYSKEGVQQGGPLSPFLSNIILDEFDKELEDRGHKFCRFADDSNIYVKSERSGNRVMKSINKFIMQKLKLRVNQEKSAVASSRKRSFLGFCLVRRPEISNIGISPKAIQKFKQEVKKITSRNWSIGMEKRIKTLSQYLHGWYAYFGICETRSVLKILDKWIRHRLRCVQWKQWKTYRRRMKNLIKLGVDLRTAYRTAISSKGPWRISDTTGTKIAMGINYFDKLGVPKLSTMKAFN